MDKLIVGRSINGWIEKYKMLFLLGCYFLVSDLFFFRDSI